MKTPMVSHLAMAISLMGMTCLSMAGTASTSLPVTASVTQNCTISTTAGLAFSAYDAIGTNATTPLNATGQVSVTCSKNATGLTIGMDGGAHALAGQRQMLGGTSAGLLQYNLFQPPTNIAAAACTFPGTTAWTATGAGLFTLTSAPSKTARVYSVCGTVPAGQDVAADTYTDTVSATVNF